MEKELIRFRKVIALVLIVTTVSVLPVSAAQAEEDPGAKTEFVILGVAIAAFFAVGVGLAISSSSSTPSKPSWQTKNDNQNEIERQLASAFSNSQKEHPAVATETHQTKQAAAVVVAPSVGYNPRTQTGAVGVEGAF